MKEVTPKQLFDMQQKTSKKIEEKAKEPKKKEVKKIEEQKLEKSKIIPKRHISVDQKFDILIKSLVIIVWSFTLISASTLFLISIIFPEPFNYVIIALDLLLIGVVFWINKKFIK